MCIKHYKSVSSADWYMRNKARRNASSRNYYAQNRQRAAQQDAARYAKNKAKLLAQQRQRRDADPETFRERARAWRERNVGKRRAYVRRYQAAKSRATPKWANDFIIEEIYDLAVRRTAALGIPYEVDHVVPLQSEIVCGLHVESNLQVIPRIQNIAKSNRTWPDHPEGACAR